MACPYCMSWLITNEDAHIGSMGKLPYLMNGKLGITFKAHVFKTSVATRRTIIDVVETMSLVNFLV